MNSLKPKLALFTLLMLLVPVVEGWGSFSLPSLPVVPEFENGGVRAGTLYGETNLNADILPTASLDGVAPAYEKTTTFLSPILTADFPFDAVEVDWDEFNPQNTAITIELRFQKESGTWTLWQPLSSDEIDYGTLNAEKITPATILLTIERSKALQYRVTLRSDGSTAPQVQNIQFHYIDATSTVSKNPNPETSTQSATSSATPSAPRLTFANDTLDIITREEWGADESWRLSSFYGEADPETPVTEEDIGTEATSTETDRNGDEPTIEELYPEDFAISKTVTKGGDGSTLYWPLEYSKNVKKIVIHHTAGSLTDDPEATIRAIYYYHAVRRGWGDIGYNYIIANGKIYEGRYGGDGVVGGHARGYNTGTIGISVIGNYENDEISYQDLEALSRLIEAKADVYNIDVDGYSKFHGKVIANVLGHRDVASTLCPGANLYAVIPVLREVMAADMDNTETGLIDTTSSSPYAFANSNDYDPFALEPEQETTLTLQVKNIGTETWTSNTYLIANQNPSAEALVRLKKEKTGSLSIATIQEKSVAPGEIATFKIQAQALMNGGFQNFKLTPIFNGKTKTGHYLNLPVYVETPILSYDGAKVTLSKTRVKTGEIFTGTVTIKNTGNVNWTREGSYPMVLATDSNESRKSSFLSGANKTQFATLVEDVVEPGKTGTFKLSLKAPFTGGTYTETLVPVMEGVGGLKGNAISFNVAVYSSGTQATVKAMSEDTIFTPGETKEIWITLENSGAQTWTSAQFSVGKIHHSSIGVTKPALKKNTVAPGSTGDITFSITAPTKPGTYFVYLVPRLNKQNLMSKNIKFQFTVVASGGDVALDSQDIRVKLSFDPAEDGNPVITANGPFEVYVGGKSFLELESGDEVEVRYSEGNYQMVSNAQTWVDDDYPQFIAKNSTTILKIENYENHPSWNASLNDNQFRDTLEIRYDSDESKLIAINELSMKYYLRGVGESTESEPVEKQKAMAVIARTYAQYYIEKDQKFPGKPYQANDDPDVFQKYLGYGYEIRAPHWVEAVTNTQGRVVTYNGILVKTPYFSSTDGTATKSAQEVWGWTDTPYLVSVPDPLCTTSTSFSGHGVGLSGCGATAAANAGKTYVEILKYYYTGVEVGTYASGN